MRILNPLRHVIGLSTLSSEGQVAYDSTRKALMYHDGVRKRYVSEIGWAPYAYPIGGGGNWSLTSTVSVPGGGGSVACPVVLAGHMLLDGLTYRDASSTSTRGPSEFAIYEDRLDNTGTLNIVAGAVGTLAAFTASGGSNRTLPVTSPPVYLAPGVYWVVFKNNHASTVLQLATKAAATMATGTAQTKTFTTAALGSTLDLSSGWTQVGYIPGLRLNGRVFNESAGF